EGNNDAQALVGVGALGGCRSREARRASDGRAEKACERGCFHGLSFKKEIGAGSCRHGVALHEVMSDRDAQAGPVGDLDHSIADGELFLREFLQQRIGPTEYSSNQPAGEALATCIPAANASAPVHRCGASLLFQADAIAPMRIASDIPPQIARSGWNTSTARSSARSRKSKRLNSLSPAAIGMAVAAR